MIDRDGSGNCWVRDRGNICRMIGRNSCCFRKKCRGDSSSGGFWNMCRVNMSRRIGGDAIGMIGMDAISCCRCQWRCSGCEINWNWNWNWNWSCNHILKMGLCYYATARPVDASAPPINIYFYPDDGSLPFCRLISSASTKWFQY